ncbi:MAG: DUF4238 domain-containing protein [Saprospiraceae bacterium]|jgi:hypothetical protein|nr:DUF4238 domain-containing protein [Saprospiraceae bacterium]
MKAKSTRHHYIPKFLIRGFTNSEDVVWVYDKVKDKILHKPVHPKSIFWEENRNTVKVNIEESTSLIEDEFYLKLDNDSSKALKSFQEDEITEELLSIENQGALQFFVINLFWRLPITDFAVKDLILNSKISSEVVDSEVLKNDAEFHKIKRFGLYNHTIDSITKNRPNNTFCFVKMGSS